MNGTASTSNGSTRATTAFVFNEPIRVALGKNVGGYQYVIGVYNYGVYDLSKQG